MLRKDMVGNSGKTLYNKTLSSLYWSIIYNQKQKLSFKLSFVKMNIGQKHKIAIITQRYGDGLNGGAEVHAKQIADMLCAKYDVDVLTSCASDYKTWDPTFKSGEEFDGNLKIIRFENEPRSNKKTQSLWRKRASGRQCFQRIFKFLNRPQWFLKLFSHSDVSEIDGVNWLISQGPYMPTLLTYLRNNQSEYSTFIFFTILYYPTALGIKEVGGKSILIPTLHDEKPMYMPIYQKSMSASSWILFNTEAERRFANSIFSLQKVEQRIAGVGIQLNGRADGSTNFVQDICKITDPYILYVGRIDRKKGCDTLIKYFTQLKNDNPELKLKLILVGKNEMSFVNHQDIIYTGFLTQETDKISIMQHAEILIMPSLYESLSLVLLESFACCVPVIANGNSLVLKDHIEKSQGGFTFCDYSDFLNAIMKIISNKNLRNELGTNGYNYVKENYSWTRIGAVYDEAISSIIQSTERSSI